MIYKAHPKHHDFTSIPTELSATVKNGEIVNYYMKDSQNEGMIHSYRCYSESQYRDFVNYKNSIKKYYPDLYEKIKDFPERDWKKPK